MSQPISVQDTGHSCSPSACSVLCHSFKESIREEALLLLASELGNPLRHSHHDRIVLAETLHSSARNEIHVHGRTYLEQVAQKGQRGPCAGWNISKSTKAASRSRGLPIWERASIVNSSSNRFSPIGLRYIVDFCMISTAKILLFIEISK